MMEEWKNGEPIAESAAKEHKDHKVGVIGPFLCVLCDLLWLRRTSAIASGILEYWIVEQLRGNGFPALHHSPIPLLPSLSPTAGW
jgi:hypothetical protein